MKPTIIPSILANEANEAQTRLRFVDGKTKWIQIDVLDGTLVAHRNWHDASIVNTWKIKAKIELHLMINDPAHVIDEWRGVKNLKRVIWHVEAPIDHEKLIAMCKRRKLEVGLAINPETPVAALVPFLRKLDAVLVLAVHPGRSGQTLVPSTLKKVEELRRLSPRLPINFDGGVTARNMRTIVKRGATNLNVASAVFESKHPAEQLERLQKSLSTVY